MIRITDYETYAEICIWDAETKQSLEELFWDWDTGVVIRATDGGNIYVVASVGYCIEQAHDFAANEGDFAPPYWWSEEEREELQRAVELDITTEAWGPVEAEIRAKFEEEEEEEK